MVVLAMRRSSWRMMMGFFLGGSWGENLWKHVGEMT